MEDLARVLFSVEHRPGDRRGRRQPDERAPIPAVRRRSDVRRFVRANPELGPRAAEGKGARQLKISNGQALARSRQPFSRLRDFAPSSLRPVVVMTSTRPQEAAWRGSFASTSPRPHVSRAAPPRRRRRPRRAVAAERPRRRRRKITTAGGRSLASDDERHAPGGPSRPGFDANDAKAHQHVEGSCAGSSPRSARGTPRRPTRTRPASTESRRPSSRSAIRDRHRRRRRRRAIARRRTSPPPRARRPHPRGSGDRTSCPPVRRRATGSASSPDPKSSLGVATNTAGGGASRQRREGGVKISDAGDAHIARQRAAQEELTDEMLELAGGIKANSLGDGGESEGEPEGARRRGGIAGPQPGWGQEGAIAAEGDIRDEQARGCWTWIVLVLVGVVFTWVVVRAMRFTHDRTKFRV